MSRAATALQASLLDLADRPTFASLPGRMRRIELGRGAWVDTLPGWLSGSDDLLQALLDMVPWRAERRAMYDHVVDVPRLTASYREDDPLPHPALADARERLSRHYRATLGEEVVTAGLCWYRDGRDSVAWHGDTFGRGSTHDALVAILSLGHPRSLLLRPLGGGGSLRFALGHGDLFVMGGSCQRTWQHAVPKTTRSAGPRISVQFRSPGVW